MTDHEDHAALSARHLADATARIERQRQLIGHLRRMGLDTEAAESLLQTFERTMDAMLVHDAIICRGW